MKRFKATTIMELIIVMLITTVFVAIFFFSYLKISGTFRQMESKSKYIDNVNLLFNVLKRDFEYANSVHMEFNAIEFTFNDEHKRLYTIENDKLLAHHKYAIDTFLFDSIAYSPSYKQAQQKLVNSLKLQLYHKNIAQEFFFYKKYPAKTLINTQYIQTSY